MRVFWTVLALLAACDAPRDVTEPEFSLVSEPPDTEMWCVLRIHATDVETGEVIWVAPPRYNRDIRCAHLWPHGLGRARR